MKILLGTATLLLVVAAMISSCSAPCDVSANRREIVDSTNVKVGEQRGDSLHDGLKVTPTTIDFGAVGSESKSALISMENTSRSSYEVKSLRLTDGHAGFSFEGPTQFSIPPQSTTFIRVYTTNLPAGNTSDVLVINDTFGVLLRATAITYKGQIWVTDVDFGRVKIGSSRDTTVQIINQSTVSAVVTSIALTGPDAPLFSVFMKAALPVTVGAGETMDIPVRFTPSDTLVHQALLKCDIIPAQPVDVIDTGILSGSGR